MDCRLPKFANSTGAKRALLVARVVFTAAAKASFGQKFTQRLATRKYIAIMLIRKSLPWLAFCGLTFSVHATRPSILSVGDFALGSSIDVAIEKFRAKGVQVASYAVPNTPEIAQLAPLQIIRVPSDPSINASWVIEALAGKIFYVGREIRFTSSKELSTQEILRGMKMKFGEKTTLSEETNTGLNNISHDIQENWFWNAQGQIMGDPNFTQCEVFAGTRQIAPFQIGPRMASKTGKPCATGIGLVLRTTPNDQGLISNLLLAAVDQSLIEDYGHQLYALVKAKQDSLHKQATERKTPF